MAKIYKMQKDMNVIDRGRNRPFDNCDNQIQFYRNAIRRDNEAEKRDRGSMKFIFTKFINQAILTEL